MRLLQEAVGKPLGEQNLTPASQGQPGVSPPGGAECTVISAWHPGQPWSRAKEARSRTTHSSAGRAGPGPGAYKGPAAAEETRPQGAGRVSQSQARPDP